MGRHVIGDVESFGVGDRRIVDIEGRSIGVFNVDGQFYALRNRCPHQGASLCKGRVSGTTMPSQPGEYVWGREGEIVSCPWHGWEFDITNGDSVFNPHRMKVRSYDVTLEDGSTLGEEDPGVETYEVWVEGKYVVVHF